MVPNRYLRALILLFVGALAAAQTTAPGPSAPYEQNRLSEAEIAQLVAPIALYPDPLVSQILMASTYPLEVVQADRWRKEHPDLTGDALAKALEEQSWDPSVKSLVNFPDVLSAMSEKLDLTIRLGDAFLAQQADVLAVIQNLRAKANASGALQSNEHQTVTIQPATANALTTVVEQPPTQIISIQPAQPNVIYVPSYSPTVVYGGWPYPTYPPYYYQPPPPPAYGANLVSFGVGVATGVAWGYAWGHNDWHHGEVDVDVNRNTEFNRNINRERYRSEFQNRQTARGGTRGTNAWQHNPTHRRGVAYADARSAQRFNTGASARAVQSRQDFRGRANIGRQQLASPNIQNRARTAGYTTPSAARSRTASMGTRSNSFSGVDRGGASARTASARGRASRASAPRSSASRGGGARRAGGGRGGRR